MTTIYNTSGIVNHARPSYDTPDICGDLMRIHKSVEGAIEDIEIGDADDNSDFIKSKDNAIRELSPLYEAADTKGGDIADFMQYVSNLEELCHTLTESALNVISRAEKLSKQALSLDYTMDRGEISEMLFYLAECAGAGMGCDASLKSTLQNRGWFKQHIDYLFSILDSQHHSLGVLAHKSSPTDMVVGIDGWMYISDKLVHLVNGKDDLKLNPKNGDLEIYSRVGGQLTCFRLSEMKDIFMDLLNPTEEEIQMYEMCSHKRYDISMWRDIFGKKPK